jgi:predicted transcriptional regulator
VARRGGRTAVDITAENIGAALGRVAARLDSWKAQRAEIAAELNRVVAAAQRMLSHLGPEGAAARAVPNRGGRKKGYKMSAATKAKIRAAWQKRKADSEAIVQDVQKHVQKTKRKLSAAARAKISAAQKKRWAEQKKSST